MGLTLTEKILKAHVVDGEFVKGKEIGIKIDQTLTQDATGTMAYLEFETMGIPRVQTELSVAYVDHNTLQSGFENADDHRYIQTVTTLLAIENFSGSFLIPETGGLGSFNTAIIGFASSCFERSQEYVSICCL